MTRFVSAIATGLFAASLPAAAWATTPAGQAPRLAPGWRPPPPRTLFLQTVQTDDGDGAEPIPDTTLDPEARERQYDLEINFRGRMVSVPDSLLDIWYFSEDDPSWADGSRGRPKLRGYGLGLELVLKGDNANGIFYLEYVKSLVAAGYWDDREEPADPLDGDFLDPSNNLGLAVFGADYAYEAHFIRTEDTDGAFGMSFVVGGGLGVAYMIGQLDRWAPASSDVFQETGCPLGSPAFVCYDAGYDGVGVKNIPKVYPMVDINAGLRFNFGDRLVLRFEGGLHSLLYYGTAIGIMF